MEFQVEDPAMVKQLLDHAVEGKWGEVANMYDKYPSLQNAKLTASEETALHIAVSESTENAVKLLVESIDKQSEWGRHAPSGLRGPNNQGNTPLHLAALIGNVGMCTCIAGGHEELVSLRNNRGETPLFLAALRGKKEAFRYLHSMCGPAGTHDGYIRRADGQTILHAAISGEYFDLAYDIICNYDHLIRCVDGNGYTPLHVLAGKPAVFKSSLYLSRFSRFIYNCLHVEKPTNEPVPIGNSLPTFKGKMKPKKYPENYKTCIDFFQPLLKMLHNMIKRPVSVIHRENLPTSMKHMGANKANIEDLEERKGDTPQNQGNIKLMMIIKFMSRSAMLLIGGLVWLFGSRELRKMRAKKEKNIWSLKIMRLLLQKSSSHTYSSSGGCNPWPLAMPNQIDYFPEPKQMDCCSEPEGADQRSRDLIKMIQQAEKENNIWLPQIMNLQLLLKSPLDTYHASTRRHPESFSMPREKDQMGYLSKPASTNHGTETPILLAAKNGITEMVMEILELFPTAIRDRDSANKNIVHLAVENRRTLLYDELVRNISIYESAFRAVDNNGNSVLHVAATLGDHRPFPFATLQIQWEIKWYKYVKESVPRDFFPSLNNEDMTPKEIFRKSHESLVKEGGKWLAGTSNSCSLVSTLVATVAFATTATVPGGMKEDSGRPNFEQHPGFLVFAISSLIALSFSVTSVIAFLSILTSRYDQKDFGRDLPKKLFLALTSLFISLAAVLVCFCAGHFFLVKDEFQHAAFLVMYVIAYLPIAYFAMMQFPFYFALILQTFKRVPRRTPFR